MGQAEVKSILDRIGGEPEQDGYHFEDEYRAFGVSRHAVSLNCIFKTGNQVGISWSLFCDAEFDPSKGITVHFTNKTVAIAGSQLLPLYHAILGHRVTFVAEADRATSMIQAESRPTTVKSICVQNETK